MAAKTFQIYSGEQFAAVFLNYDDLTLLASGFTVRPGTTNGLVFTATVGGSPFSMTVTAAHAVTTGPFQTPLPVVMSGLVPLVAGIGDFGIAGL
jgi:hypothetical protein